MCFFLDCFWNEVFEFGEVVDCCFEDGDVRLIMGGELIFVLSDDFVGEEWIVDVVGFDKLVCFEEFICWLCDCFFLGVVLFYGQGKWYFGELLLRWLLSCVLCCDGVLIWQDLQWLVILVMDFMEIMFCGENFGCELVCELGVDDEYVMVVYEDIGYYFWKEQCLLIDVDLFELEFDDLEEWVCLVCVFGCGFGELVGWVLLLQVMGVGVECVW